MALTAGLGNTGSYQASGRPLVMQGPNTYTLSFVTKAITVSVPTGGVAGTISFDGDPAVFNVVPGESFRFEVRVVKFTTAGANTQVVAELTNIPAPDLALLATDPSYHTP